MTDRRLLEDLKISALSTGARLTDAALEHLGGPSALTVHEYATTGGIPLRVDGIDINTPFDEWYCAQAELLIDVVDDELQVQFRGTAFPVDAVHPLPGYLGLVDGSGHRFDETVYTHIERVRVSPIAGCAYDCGFCDMPGRVRLRPLEQMQKAVDAALADGALEVRHALISGGSPGPRDESQFADVLVELAAYIAERVEVDVMMAASETGPELVRRLVDAGVHGFAFNIELESNDAAAVHIRGKHRRSRPHFDATVTSAVEILGRTGRVRSLILPGLEPVDATLAGVAHIASLGADPVLSPFRPAVNTRLSRSSPVPASVLREVLDGSRQIVQEHDVALGPRCIPCQHNTLSFPWDVT